MLNKRKDGEKIVKLATRKSQEARKEREEGSRYEDIEFGCGVVQRSDSDKVRAPIELTTV